MLLTTFIIIFNNRDSFYKNIYRYLYFKSDLNYFSRKNKEIII